MTAAFNLNLIERINRELDGTMPVDGFRHRAIWNDDRARIEMHLEAVRDIAFTVDGRSFAMAAGETIHTENSHKYGPRDARILLRTGGWTPVAEWTIPTGCSRSIWRKPRRSGSRPRIGVRGEAWNGVPCFPANDHSRTTRVRQVVR